MSERESRITLRLEGPKITAEKFAQAVNAFFDLLDEVSQTITGSGKAVRWIITLEHGSNLLHATPEVKDGVKSKMLVRTISHGVDLVGRRAQRPRYFTDSALRLTRDLASVPDGDEIKVAQIKASPSEKVTISQKTAENVSRLLGEDIEEYGTIEGRLLTLSQRHSPHFAVYDPLTDQPVRCNVKEDQLDQAWRAFGRRVAVSGIIRYRKTGQPVSIEAESLFVFPSDDDLPSADEVYGILGGAQ